MTVWSVGAAVGDGVGSGSGKTTLSILWITPLSAATSRVTRSPHSVDLEQSTAVGLRRMGFRFTRMSWPMAVSSVVDVSMKLASYLSSPATTWKRRSRRSSSGPVAAAR